MVSAVSIVGWADAIFVMSIRHSPVGWPDHEPGAITLVETPSPSVLALLMAPSVIRARIFQWQIYRRFPLQAGCSTPELCPYLDQVVVHRAMANTYSTGREHSLDRRDSQEKNMEKNVHRSKPESARSSKDFQSFPRETP